MILWTLEVGYCICEDRVQTLWTCSESSMSRAPMTIANINALKLLMMIEI